MEADVLGITILIGSFFILLAVRVPVAFALGTASIFTAWHLDLPLMIVAQQMTKGLNSFSLMAIPFFILAGQQRTTVVVPLHVLRNRLSTVVGNRRHRHGRPQQKPERAENRPGGHVTRSGGRCSTLFR